MADSILRNKSKEFAKSIVFLCRILKQNGVKTAIKMQVFDFIPKFVLKFHYTCYL